MKSLGGGYTTPNPSSMQSPFGFTEKGGRETLLGLLDDSGSNIKDGGDYIGPRNEGNIIYLVYKWHFFLPTGWFYTTYHPFQQAE